MILSKPILREGPSKGGRMSIRLSRYAGFPPEIFEQEIVPKMRDRDLRLYFFLCWSSDRKSTRQFSTTDKEVGLRTGASPRALRDARINLKALGLVHFDKAQGGEYTYTLCDPNTGLPSPGDPKVKAPYTKKLRPVQSENRITRPDGSVDYGFNGQNAPTKPSTHPKVKPKPERHHHDQQAVPTPFAPPSIVGPLAVPNPTQSRDTDFDFGLNTESTKKHISADDYSPFETSTPRK